MVFPGSAVGECRKAARSPEVGSLIRLIEQRPFSPWFFCFSVGSNREKPVNEKQTFPMSPPQTAEGCCKVEKENNLNSIQKVRN